MPPTERKGRVHTSTVTVAVIDPTHKAVTVNQQDLKIEWYSGTGAGGQHRNKHQNSCRVTHIPTGQVATAQCRSRQNSLEQATSDILMRVTNQKIAKNYEDSANLRKQQVGSGMRGDKIRTYRFQDDSVKDHVTGKSSTTKKIMGGDIDLLW